MFAASIRTAPSTAAPPPEPPFARFPSRTESQSEADIRPVICARKMPPPSPARKLVTASCPSATTGVSSVTSLPRTTRDSREAVVTFCAKSAPPRELKPTAAFARREVDRRRRSGESEAQQPPPSLPALFDVRAQSVRASDGAAAAATAPPLPCARFESNTQPATASGVARSATAPPGPAVALLPRNTARESSAAAAPESAAAPPPNAPPALFPAASASWKSSVALPLKYSAPPAPRGAELLRSAHPLCTRSSARPSRAYPLSTDSATPPPFPAAAVPKWISVDSTDTAYCPPTALVPGLPAEAPPGQVVA